MPHVLVFIVVLEPNKVEGCGILGGKWARWTEFL